MRVNPDRSSYKENQNIVAVKEKKERRNVKELAVNGVSLDDRKGRTCRAHQRREKRMDLDRRFEVPVERESRCP